MRAPLRNPAILIVEFHFFFSNPTSYVWQNTIEMKYATRTSSLVELSLNKNSDLFSFLFFARKMYKKKETIFKKILKKKLKLNKNLLLVVNVVQDNTSFFVLLWHVILSFFFFAFMFKNLPKKFPELLHQNSEAFFFTTSRSRQAYTFYARE